MAAHQGSCGAAVAYWDLPPQAVPCCEGKARRNARGSAGAQDEGEPEGRGAPRKYHYRGRVERRVGEGGFGGSPRLCTSFPWAGFLLSLSAAFVFTSCHYFLRLLMQAGKKLVVLEVQSQSICQSGRGEEPELHWKADKEAALEPCKELKHVFLRTARDCSDVVFLELDVRGLASRAPTPATMHVCFALRLYAAGLLALAYLSRVGRGSSRGHKPLTSLLF
jgi:hypothetical protein